MKGKSPETAVPEKEFRQKILNMAKRLNCEQDVIAIFNKYDKALKNCTNETERKHIATCGAAELHRFFYCKGNLVVGGQEVIPAETGHADDGQLIKPAK